MISSQIILTMVTWNQLHDRFSRFIVLYFWQFALRNALHHFSPQFSSLIAAKILFNWDWYQNNVFYLQLISLHSKLWFLIYPYCKHHRQQYFNTYSSRLPLQEKLTIQNYSYFDAFRLISSLDTDLLIKLIQLIWQKYTHLQILNLTIIFFIIRT